MSRVITPGGRVGDDASHNRSPKENWVDKAGGLPRYIRIVRNGLMKDGKSESQATALAVAAIKRWAHGGDNVTPKVQAAAAAALTEWEKMKGTKSFDGDTVGDSEFKAAFAPTLLADIWGAMELPIIEAKDDAMSKLQYKAAAVSGLTVDDADNGIVTTIVSVTGVKDNVRDVIHPGAYQKSLMARTPKGVWSHAWDTPVSKTLDVKELMPGDALLPKTLPNGDPFPEGAGALLVKTQFNLDTQRGREAYSDVVFFGDQQEWSIGYQVPPGGARMDSKSGVRHIDYLELYEYSPVLFGAMSAARTVTDPARAGAGVKVLDYNEDEDAYMEFDSVRAAQTAYKSISMSVDEFKEWRGEMESKSALGIRHGLGVCDDDDCADCKGKRGSAGAKADDPEDHEEKAAGIQHAGSTDEEDEADLGLFDSLGIGGLGIGIKSYDYETLVKARDAIDFILTIADQHAAEQKQADPAVDDPEEKVDEPEAVELKSLADIIDANADTLGDATAEMKDAAEAFDMAFKDNDADGMNEYGMEVLTIVEKSLATAEDENAVLALHKVAAGVAAMAPEDEVDEEDVETADPVEEDDTEKKPRPAKPGKKDGEPDDIEVKTVTIDASELDLLRVGFHNRFNK